MRCKNCGSENDDNLYICQNCGSPLYDEDEELGANENEATRVFTPPEVGGDTKRVDLGAGAPVMGTTPNVPKDNKKTQTIVIIAVLAVVLIAIIAGIVIAAVSKKGDDETSSLTRVTTSEVVTSDDYTTSTTKETTTEATTEETTTTTTQAATFTVSLTGNEGGEVEGEGSYKRGENVTVIARPSDGYDFDGWYEGTKKVSSNTDYTFTVTKDRSLDAVFVLIEDGEIDIVNGEDD